MRRRGASWPPCLVRLTILAAILLLWWTPRPSWAQPAVIGQTTVGIVPGRIAFARDGDIHTLDLSSGAETQITDDGDNSEPRWSPSGNWIAYLKGPVNLDGQGELWISEADGSQAHRVQQFKGPMQFAWSPAADVLAFRTSDGGLAAESADGSTQQTLVAGPNVDRFPGVQDLAWSPDGAWLAFDRFDIPAEPNLQPGMSLWRIRPDGSDETQVFDGAGWFALDGWSQDGSQLLYFPHANSASLSKNGGGLDVISAGGGTPQDLLSDVPPNHSTMLMFRDFVAEDPAGSGRIAVVEGFGPEDWVEKSLHLLVPATGDDTALTGPNAVVSSPAWSPNGRYLAYVSMPPPDPPIRGIMTDDEIAHVAAVLMNRHLMLADPGAQAAPRQLTDDPAYRDEAPRWSPDGSALLFARVDAASDSSLWAMPAAGGTPTELVDDLSLGPGPGRAVPAAYLLGYGGHVDWGMLLDWWTPHRSLTSAAGRRLAQSARRDDRARPRSSTRAVATLRGRSRRVERGAYGRRDATGRFWFSSSAVQRRASRRGVAAVARQAPATGRAARRHPGASHGGYGAHRFRPRRGRVRPRSRVRR